VSAVDPTHQTACGVVLAFRNKDYSPPSPPTALVVNMEFISAAGQGCVTLPPSTTGISIEAVLGQIQRYISLAQPGLISELDYYTAGYSCTPVSMPVVGSLEAYRW